MRRLLVSCLLAGLAARAAAFTVTTAVTPNLCAGGAAATVTAQVTGGVGPFQFVWSGGGLSSREQTVTGLSQGTYLVVVTDLDTGEEVPGFAVVTDPTPLTVFASAQRPTCHAGADGELSLAVAGGTPPYGYDWYGTPPYDGSAAATGLRAGRHTVTVTDRNGCARTQTLILSEPPAIEVELESVRPATCPGGADGALAISSSGNGALTFDWDGEPEGDGTTSVTNVAAGLHTVTVTDETPCTVVRTFEVPAPPVLLPNGSSTPLLAVGTCTGTARVAPSGGTPPYSIAWTPIASTAEGVDALCGPTATATVTDAHQCTATFVASIEGPTADLSVSLVGPSGAVHDGGTIELTIEAAASAHAPLAVVSGSTPTGAGFEALAAPDGWTCTAPEVGAAGPFQCTAAALEPGAPATFTLRVAIPPKTAPLVLTTTAASSAAVNDPDASNNAATVTTEVTPPPAPPPGHSCGNAAAGGTALVWLALALAVAVRPRARRR